MRYIPEADSFRLNVYGYSEIALAANVVKELVIARIGDPATYARTNPPHMRVGWFIGTPGIWPLRHFEGSVDVVRAEGDAGGEQLAYFRQKGCATKLAAELYDLVTGKMDAFALAGSNQAHDVRAAIENYLEPYVSAQARAYLPGDVKVARTAAGNPECRYMASWGREIYGKSGYANDGTLGDYANGSTAIIALQRLYLLMRENLRREPEGNRRPGSPSV